MFSRENRLAQDGDIQRVLRTGRKFFCPLFTIRWREAHNAVMPPRFAVVVSTKVAKRAVKRNRLRRITRELLRKNLRSIHSADYMIILRPEVLKVPEAEYLQTLAGAFEKAKLLV